MLGILAALVAGGVIVIIRKLTRSETAATIYSSQCVITLLLTAPLAAPDFAGIPTTAWILMMLGGFIVAWGQILITKGFYHLDIARGSALQMLVPLFTGLGAFFLFGERFTPVEILGAVITLFATWQISTSSPKEEKS